MGELILCNSPLAANSYYIEEASLNIYSLEELSFYIYNNTYLLDETFVSPALCKWIEKEVHDKRLAKELTDLLDEDARLNVLIGHILRNNGYLTKSEIRHCLDIISSFEGKTEAEIRKLRADHMMNDGRIADAVFSYEMILDRKLPMNDVLKGNIMHNLGCALCGLFFFKRAAEFFEQAYRLNRNNASLEKLLYSCLFSEDEEAFAMYVMRYQVLPETAKRIRDDYKSILLESSEITEYEFKLNEKLSHAKDEVEKEFIFNDYLDDIKANYRSLRTF